MTQIERSITSCCTRRAVSLDHALLARSTGEIAHCAPTNPRACKSRLRIWPRWVGSGWLADWIFSRHAFAEGPATRGNPGAKAIKSTLTQFLTMVRRRTKRLGSSLAGGEQAREHHNLPTLRGRVASGDEAYCWSAFGVFSLRLHTRKSTSSAQKRSRCGCPRRPAKRRKLSNGVRP
jgi:hypothetical protein